MKIEFEKFKSLIDGINFYNYGAITEKEYSLLVGDYFPNCEKFWKYVIVPWTNRIDNTIDRNNFDKKIDCRNDISPRLNEIGSFHYSVFQNLFYSYFILKNKHFSYFEDFYVHLVSACDSAEEVIHLIHLLILECTNQSREVLEFLTEEKFLNEYAPKWFRKNYSTLYEYYLSKGKGKPIKLPDRDSVLGEYFRNSNEWQKYDKFSTALKQYRNTIIHGYTIAGVIDEKGENLVPKKERIGSYKKWRQVQNIITDPNIIQNDFISRTAQMHSDFIELKVLLNDLWRKVINDMNELLYVQKNEILLKKYNLEFI